MLYRGSALPAECSGQRCITTGRICADVVYSVGVALGTGNKLYDLLRGRLRTIQDAGGFTLPEDVHAVGNAKNLFQIVANEHN